MVATYTLGYEAQLPRDLEPGGCGFQTGSDLLVPAGRLDTLDQLDWTRATGIRPNSSSDRPTTATSTVEGSNAIAYSISYG